MVPDALDEVDRGILFLLQQNARRNTTTDIAGQVDVSSSTVANRIKKMEDRDVIVGYHPAVDYEAAGLEFHLQVVGSVPFESQSQLLEELLEVSGVVSARSLLTMDRNVSLEVVRASREEIEESLRELVQVGLTIDRIEIVDQERVRPFDEFGKSTVDGE